MSQSQLFLNLYLKFFFVLTPFFVTSVFMTMTKDYEVHHRRRIAVRVTFAVVVTCFTLYLFGDYIFNIFGITIDAFRVGAGALLFLSAVALIHGSAARPADSAMEDVSVVPLAIPVTVGPATTGVLLIMGAEANGFGEKIFTMSALLCSILTVGVLLYLSGKLERWLGIRGLAILSKVTGLVLSSMAAQMIFVGAKNLLK
jgi:multiple antibiotic resistance protein